MQNFEQSYQFQQIIEDAKLGKVMIYDNQFGLLVAKKENLISENRNEENFLNQVIISTGQGPYSGKNLLKLIAYKIEDVSDSIFSIQSQLTSYVEFFPQKLEQQIYARHQ